MADGRGDHAGRGERPPEETIRFFGDDGDRLQMMFNFHANLSLDIADGRPLAQALEDTRERPEVGQWGVYLRNHDELDLGRLSDEERDRKSSGRAAPSAPHGPRPG